MTVGNKSLLLEFLRACLLLALLIAWPAPADTLTCRVVRVGDGDTIYILDSNKTQHKIRLQGIDAPERKQAFSKRSRENLAGYVVGEIVVIEYDKHDPYGRVVGTVLLTDEDINLKQVQDGFAWHYKRYQDEQTTEDRGLYSRAENEAKKAKRRLWRELNPVPPWDWRGSNRNREQRSPTNRHQELTI